MAAKLFETQTSGAESRIPRHPCSAATRRNWDWTWPGTTPPWLTKDQGTDPEGCRGRHRPGGHRHAHVLPQRQEAGAEHGSGVPPAAHRRRRNQQPRACAVPGQRRRAIAGMRSGVPGCRTLFGPRAGGASPRAAAPGCSPGTGLRSRELSPQNRAHAPGRILPC